MSSDLRTHDGIDGKWPFVLLVLLITVYLAFIGLLVLGDVWFASSDPEQVMTAITSQEIRYATALSLATSVVSTALAILIGLPAAWLFSRYQFPGRRFVDAVMDIPILLPPLVVGISLLILFRQTWLREMDDWLGIAFHIPAIVIAQTTVVTAFAYRTLRGTFVSMSPLAEQVACSLGCSRWQSFCWVAVPAARQGILAAATLAWARSIGQFGPVLVFAGSTRGHTEVLPVSIFLEMNQGRLVAATGISVMMIALSVSVLVLVRWLAGDSENDVAASTFAGASDG